MKALAKNFRELFKYPSAVLGLLLVFALIVVSIYTMIKIPYKEAIVLWRGGEDQWYRNPKYALPKWINFFRSEKLPETIAISTVDHPEYKTVETNEDGSAIITMEIPFEYKYNLFPDDMMIRFTSNFTEKAPFVSVSWIKPDEQKVRIKNFSISPKQDYRISQDKELQKKLGGNKAEIGLFTDYKNDQKTIEKGKYTILIEGATFEKGSDFNAEFIAYGKVAGAGGTDHLRRDLIVALLWGAPIALAFGLLAAVGTTLTQMIIAAAGTWFGGWVDMIIQRITEINLVLPFLPILIMIGTFYSRSLWVILTAVIILNIFGTGIKTFRAVFMQTKETPYIEAARAYGANNVRIIFTYMIPRILPMLIPQFIILIPSYVFLEASLAVLGLGDPTLPTWGKIIDDARANGALFQGWYYWVLEPSALLMITGLAFAMLGFSLDRIFNPRLRGM
ncbi:MAG: ABC transporter permease [Chloroflexi bacterium]|nr:ABC transporter permease [Chloroflexota bacterium]